MLFRLMAASQIGSSILCFRNGAEPTATKQDGDGHSDSRTRSQKDFRSTAQRFGVTWSSKIGPRQLILPILSGRRLMIPLSFEIASREGALVASVQSARATLLSSVAL